MPKIRFLLLTAASLAWAVAFLGKGILFDAQAAFAEPIAVIVNKSNSATELRLSELNRIYRGKVTKWPTGEKITVINREPTAPIRAVFYKQALNAKVNERFLLPGTDLPFRTLVLSSSALVKQVVKTVKGAIGYINFSEADDSVKILKIDGFKPGEEGYKLVGE